MEASGIPISFFRTVTTTLIDNVYIKWEILEAGLGCYHKIPSKCFQIGWGSKISKLST